MQQASDLVTDSQLETTFDGDLTTHLIKIVQANVRRREIKHKQIWRREKKPLGEGSSGIVWHERLSAGPSTCDERAVKVVRKRIQNSDLSYFNRELEAIAKFSHPKYNDCFVQSYGWYEDDTSIFIAMEYFPCGDLQSFMASALVETDVREISSQILEGLDYMHGNGFTHRDLNPRNILVRSPGPEWWVKIGDFGISKRAVEDGTVLRTFTGTQGFMAPEVLVRAGLFECENTEDYNDYSFAVDIWSLGEIVFRALTKHAPFPFPRDLGAYIKDTMAFPEFQLHAQKVSRSGCDFVEQLLKPKPKDRPTASAAMNHPWLTSTKRKSLLSHKELSRAQEGSSDNPYEMSENNSGISRSEGPVTMIQFASQGRPWTPQDTGRWTDLDEYENQTTSQNLIQASSSSGTKLSPHHSSLPPGKHSEHQMQV